MAAKNKNFNEYEIVDNYVIIRITNKKGETHQTYVDLDDLQKLIDLNYSWHLFWSKTTKSYYVKTSIRFTDDNNKRKGNTLYLHRLILPSSKEMYIDHINHDTLDNRKDNLRIVTNSENHANRENRPNINSTTGIRNVTYDNRNNKYMVQVWDGKKNIILGRYKSLKKAEEIANKNRCKFYKNVV